MHRRDTNNRAKVLLFGSVTAVSSALRTLKQYKEHSKCSINICLVNEINMCVCAYIHVQMFLLMKCSNKKLGNTSVNNFHLYAGILDFHLNKIQRNFSAPSKIKDHILSSFLVLFPFFLNWTFVVGMGSQCS